MILPWRILPLSIETVSQISASVPKKMICDGRYPFSPEGLVEMTIRNDTASMTISANKVIALNRRISISFQQY
jgi:hypothetical protein